MTKKRKIQLIIGLLLFINFSAINAFAAVHRLTGKEPPTTYRIVLTRNGFSPETTTLKKGDTVVFSTNTGKKYWPASNLHPTHDIYPAFDPRRPIEPDKTWSFRFDQEGSWQFHDHLEPIFRGTIIVQGGSSAENGKPVSSLDTCSTISQYEQKQQCVESLFTYTLATDGVEGGFDLLDKIFTRDPDFAVSCHDFAHRLGQKTYQTFKDDKNIVLSEKSSYCGYGFYHGFMEELLHTTGNLEEARSFCEYAGEKLRAKTRDAAGACYHGIGHGLVEDTPDPASWGDAEKIIQPALALCRQVSPDTDKKFRCDTGVFNALEILMSSNRYNLILDRDDPAWICKKQEEGVKAACYTQMVVAILNATGHDFHKSASIIASISEDRFAIPTMNTLAVELVHTMKHDFPGALSFCRGLGDRFRVACIYSFAEGFVKYGPPQEEYKDALRFCRSDLLQPDEKEGCYRRILGIFRIFYTVEKSTALCRTVPSEFQYNDCRYD